MDIYINAPSVDVELSVFLLCRETYLTGSPQRENIVGCGTHSGEAFVATTQPFGDRQQHVTTKYCTENEEKKRRIQSCAGEPLSHTIPSNTSS